MDNEKNEMLPHLHLLLVLDFEILPYWTHVLELTKVSNEPCQRFDSVAGLSFELLTVSPGFGAAWLAGWVFSGRRSVLCTLPSLTLCLLSANANVCR